MAKRSAQPRRPARQSPAARQSDTLLIAGALVILMLIVAGVVALGGSSAAEQPDPEGAQFSGIPAGEDVERSSGRYQPSELLPATPPDVDALLLSARDNSLLVSTGGSGFVVGEDGSLTTDGSSGQQLEVVLTPSSKIYRDRTAEVYATGSGNLQQTLEETSAEEIAPNSRIRVWGERRGDRIIAEVVTHSLPFITRTP